MIETKKILNFLDIIGICAVLIFAFYIQIFWHEEPCPLCNLQRLAWIGVAIGILLNLRFGISSRHYSLSLLSALIGAGVALRQVTLHIVPGEAGFGAPIFGLHLYTLSFMGFIVSLFYLALLMFFGDNKNNLKGGAKKKLISPDILRIRTPKKSKSDSRLLKLTPKRKKF